jgi:alpha-ribazole phosphatase
MQVYLIRHTRVNLSSGICYGQSDVGLANTFEIEAEQVKQKICKLNFDAVYSSPLKRCISLARVLSEQEISIDPRLMELNFGKWEMLPWDKVTGDYAEKWMSDFVNVPCLDGESYLQLYERAKAFLDNLKISPYQQVLVVTHGGIIRAMLALLRGTKLEDSFKADIPFGHVEKVEV